MPDAKIIGRIAVKVLPDTSNFRKDTEAELDREEKRLKINVQVVPDVSRLDRQLLEAVRDINARNRESDLRKIKLYTQLDTSSARMRESLNKAVREYERLSETNRVKLKSSLVGGTVELDVDDENLRKVKEKIDHWARSVSPVKIPVKLDLNGPMARLTGARIDELARPRSVKLRPEVDNAAATKAAAIIAALSGGRVLNDFFGKFKSFIRDLDKSVPLVGGIALAIAGLAGWGLTASANLFALSSSLASIGGAGLAIPGILGGIAVGLTTTIVALKDFKKYVPEVSAAWSQIQSTISSNFWAKAQAPIRNMVDKLLPEFTAGFGKTSTAIGGYFGHLATALGTSFDGPVKGMFANLTKSINIASGGTGGLADIITRLGTTGASFLPRLATYFNQVTQRFDDFLKRADADGSLKRWINNGIEALKALGSVIKNIFGIFSGLSKAMTAAGGSTLSMFAATLGQVNKVVNSKGFQDGMVRVFRAAFEAMHNIAAVAGPAVKSMFSSLSTTLAQVLPQVGKTIGALAKSVATVLGSPAVQKGLTDLFAGIAQGVDALAPAIEQLAPVIGQLGSLIGTMAAAFGPVLAAAIGAVAPALTKIIPVFTPLVEILSQGLADALVMVTPLITMLGKTFAQMAPLLNLMATAVVGLISPLVDALGPVMAALMPPLTSLFKLLAGALAQILPSLGQQLGRLIKAFAPIVGIVLDLVVTALKPLIPVIVKLATQLLPPLVDILIALAPVIKVVAVALAGLLVGIATLISGGLNVLISVFTILASTLAGGVTAAVSVVTSIFAGLKTYFGAWVQFFSDLIHGNWSALWQDAKNILSAAMSLFITIVSAPLTVIQGLFTGFWNGIKSVFGSSISSLKSLWNGLFSAITGVASSAWDSVKNFTTGAFNAVKSVVSSALGSVKSTVSNDLNAVKNVVSNAMSSVKGFFSGAWAAVLSGVHTAFSSVVSFFRGLPGRIIGAVGNLDSVLINAGEAVIRGFVQGIENMAGKVKSALGNITSKLTSWKGPPKTDKVILTPAGQMVIQGFINGINSMVPQVKGTLGSLTSSLTDMGSDMGTGLLDGLESTYDALHRSLGAFADKISSTSIQGPTVTMAAQLAGLSGSMQGAQPSSSRTFNYYAAPGNTLPEEDVFAASSRSRFAW